MFRTVGFRLGGHENEGSGPRRPHGKLISVSLLALGRAVFGAALLLVMPSWQSAAGSLSETITRVKPGVVGVGTYQVTRRPPSVIRGTGFVVADGLHIMTNAHVIPDDLNEERRETLSIFVAAGGGVHRRVAKLIASDVVHDVALLEISGQPLPILRINDDKVVEEGQSVAFTGFPIGAVLGLHPVTHRGIISAITPIVESFVNPRVLDVKTIKRLRDPYAVFQLDATAYPGNSGSPLYDTKTGEVYAIVSSVFVKGTKERVLQEPTGITYAIPIRYGAALLRKAGLQP